MHAYAADDPVFLAMNARAQRETGGRSARSASTATRHGRSRGAHHRRPRTWPSCRAEEGRDLLLLPRGRVRPSGTHDNPLVLAKDDSLFGPFGIRCRARRTSRGYSALLDDTAESAAACGSCHDIVNPHGAHVERTFAGVARDAVLEARDGPVVRAVPHGGQRRSRGDHLDADAAPAQPRFPRPSIWRLTDFPARRRAARPRAGAARHDRAVHPVLEPRDEPDEVTLDNVGAGPRLPERRHARPARLGRGGRLPAGGSACIRERRAAAAPLEDSADPDLWLVRDCLFDAAGAERTCSGRRRASRQPAPGRQDGERQPIQSFMPPPPAHLPGDGRAGFPAPPDRITLGSTFRRSATTSSPTSSPRATSRPRRPRRIARFELAGAALEWDARDGSLQPRPQDGLPQALRLLGDVQPEASRPPRATPTAPPEVPGAVRRSARDADREHDLSGPAGAGEVQRDPPEPAM